MKKRLVVLAVASLFAGLLSGCGTATDPSEAYKDESSHEIFAKGKTALQDKGYTEAIKRFEALDVQYPYGVDTEDSQLYIIYAYYMKEDYVLAAAAADRFIRIHPTSPHVDYAYFMRGLSDYYQNLGVIERFFAIDLATRDLSQIEKSYNDFNALVTHFPHSQYTPVAHQYLIYLRNIMADHQLEVAQYYYSRNAFMAAANRAADVVKYYQGAPAVKDALILMAQSYHQLGLTKMEQDTLLVIQYNYPGTKVSV